MLVPASAGANIRLSPIFFPHQAPLNTRHTDLAFGFFFFYSFRIHFHMAFAEPAALGPFQIGVKKNGKYLYFILYVLAPMRK